MAGVRYNGTDYYYVKNAQGDVEAILNAEVEWNGKVLMGKVLHYGK